MCSPERGIRRLRWAITLAGALAACDPGTVTEVDPPSDPPEPIGSRIEVTATQPGNAAAGGADVHQLQFSIRQPLWTTSQTDDAGKALLTPVREGALYWLAVEMAHPTWGILGGGQKAYGPTGLSQVQVPLSAPRTEGVVISEVHMTAPPIWETGNWHYDGSIYIEVANNSDQVIYLDGMLVGKLYTWWGDTSAYGHHSCEVTEPMRNDPDGIWSNSIWRFPGSGGEHPLAPGEAAVIARVAADHRDVHPSLLDLSDASFEFIEPGDADNPSAANMVHVGPSPRGSVQPEFTLIHAFWFIAAPADVESFPLRADPGTFAYQEHLYRRVPAELLHDVVFIWWDPDGDPLVAERDACSHPVHPSFDAIPGGFVKSSDIYLSAQRRRVTVEGRQVLLDTNTSRVDFELAERTPGWLP